MSGVPQGSVLGHILFLIYINDLEDDISSKVLKFADDTKVFRKVTNDTDKQSLQDDLDKLVKWSEKWQILLNFGGRIVPFPDPEGLLYPLHTSVAVPVNHFGTRPVNNAVVSVDVVCD